MLIGEIYKWVTTQARGYEERTKYHVFICEDSVHQNVFLFINSENYYQDFEITQTDYPFLSKTNSFIGCEGIVCYENREIAHLTQSDCVGRLTPECMARLADHLINCNVMTGKEKRLVCTELKNGSSI